MTKQQGERAGIPLETVSRFSPRAEEGGRLLFIKLINRETVFGKPLAEGRHQADLSPAVSPAILLSSQQRCDALQVWSQWT
jgi:hypothetical protein